MKRISGFALSLLKTIFSDWLMVQKCFLGESEYFVHDAYISNWAPYFFKV